MIKSMCWAAGLSIPPRAKLLAFYLAGTGGDVQRLDIQDAAVWCSLEPVDILIALEQIPEIQWKEDGDYHFLIKMPSARIDGFGRSPLVRSAA